MQKLHVILEIHGQFQDSGISRISCDRSNIQHHRYRLSDVIRYFLVARNESLPRARFPAAAKIQMIHMQLPCTESYVAWSLEAPFLVLVLHVD